MKNLSAIAGGIALATVLSACSDDAATTPPSTGVFLDSPVINIGFQTETLTGVTNTRGEFDYLPGETVTFFIGNLEFPSVAAADVVTPLDLAGTTNTADATVVNMVRLLQTLDQDGDPTNGIEITDTATDAAVQVDFSLPVAEFEVSQAVIDVITAGGQATAVTQLVSEVDAIAHFEQTLDESYSVDLTTVTASSVITNSNCPGVPGGWDYTFTATSMTLTGSDSWNEQSGCTLGAQVSLTETMPLASDFDIPFNCVAYPVCTGDDFNKVLQGVDGDGRDFVSTYTFDREAGVLTYEKSVQGTVYTEVITIQ